MTHLRRNIIETVSRIPRGRVSTYGDVARMAGAPGSARQVGYALHDLSQATAVPWHRVVNTRGAVSPRASGDEDLQRKLLEAEGVRFRLNGSIDLALYRWRPDDGKEAG